VATALKRTLADERGRWVLGAHAEAKSEYRIRTRDRILVIDRVFRDAGGQRWIVDFKTSGHEGGEVEVFLDQQRERYAAQLDAYADALGGARKGIYLPLLAGWREW
jgi:ATP-dependent exoDNAse (exonuclease V) beta subunit